MLLVAPGGILSTNRRTRKDAADGDAIAYCRVNDRRKRTWLVLFLPSNIGLRISTLPPGTLILPRVQHRRPSSSSSLGGRSRGPRRARGSEWSRWISRRGVPASEGSSDGPRRNGCRMALGTRVARTG